MWIESSEEIRGRLKLRVFLNYICQTRLPAVYVPVIGLMYSLEKRSHMAVVSFQRRKLLISSFISVIIVS